MTLRDSILFLALGAFLLDTGETSAATLDVRLNLAHGGRPLLLHSFRYETSAKETFSVTRDSMLLSGFALERESGGWETLEGQVAWIDAEKRRLQFPLASIPPGKYRALRFTVGLDPETNHADPAKEQYPADHPLNPALNRLHWDWQTGYIFLALEGRFRKADGELGGWVFHFANDPNRTVIELPVKLDLTAPALAEIDFDLESLFNVPRPISFASDGFSSHSREEDSLAAMISANLPAAFRVRRVLSTKREEAKKEPVEPLYLPANPEGYPITLSGRFPVPPLPLDNPILKTRVALGERLFHETRFSRTNTIACASCHFEANAFTDPRRFSLGVDGQAGARNAMPLFNLAWKSTFFWDGRAPSLRAQALMPIEDPTEMDETLENVVAKLASDPGYPADFEAAFGPGEITPEKIGLAIENFLLTLLSYDSKFDRALRGEAELSEPEKRGLELFMTEYEPRSRQYGADCFHCHGGPLFTDNQFHNNGLGSGGPVDFGRFDVTGEETDKGKFSTPSLRNLALTAPYMHDGRFATLEEVIEHYDSGIQGSPTLDPNLAKHPVAGLGLSAEDKAALVAFLKSLTDPRFSIEAR